jgi:hypothetical protein
LVAGWIWRLYHATRDGRLFNHPVHLSSRLTLRFFVVGAGERHLARSCRGALGDGRLGRLALRKRLVARPDIHLSPVVLKARTVADASVRRWVATLRLLAVLATVARRRAERLPPLRIELYLETEHRLSRSASVDAVPVATTVLLTARIVRKGCHELRPDGVLGNSLRKIANRHRQNQSSYHALRRTEQ